MADYSVPAVSSTIQKRELSSYTDDNPSSLSLPAFKLLPNPSKADSHYYGVRIVTGSQAKAGTEITADVRVTLIGSLARSDGDKLKGWWQWVATEKKKYNDLILECSESLGQVLVVSLENRAKGSQDWYVDFVEVHDLATAEKKSIFPFYHWIGPEDNVSCSSFTGLLQDTESDPVLQKHRDHQLEIRKKKYPWKSYKDLCLPSSIDDSTAIPLDEGFELVKSIHFFSTGFTDGIKGRAHGTLSNIETIHGYEAYAVLLGEPDYRIHELGRWLSDAEFGRQILNGVNPVVIQRCKSLPAKFPVTDKMVQSFLHRGYTLAQEIEAGHIYLCDLEIMDGIPCREGTYLAAPLCLLHVNDAGQLKPIAIQLGQKPGEKNPIFLPTDGWVDWTAAKIYYMSSHSQFHQLSSHYLTCHAAMEAYGMGLMRNIPDAHPIYKLLRPHIRYTMAINSKARQTLIGSSGVIAATFAIGADGQSELLRRAGKKYSVYWSHIKANTRQRGVDDSKLLPGYHYRDDGFKIWNAIEGYVNSMISLFYPNDSAVKGDKELQHFVEDVHNIGFPAFESGTMNGHDFPSSINTIAELVDICTLIIFTGSAHHAAVNFGQYTYYAFVPNAPFVLYDPPPTTKGKLSFDQLIKLLPNEEDTQNSITIVSLLSQYSPDEMLLGTFPAELFIEEKAKAGIKEFNAKLDAISVEIQERNKSLEVPYIYLLPKKIPNSITI